MHYGWGFMYDSIIGLVCTTRSRTCAGLLGGTNQVEGRVNPSWTFMRRESRNDCAFLLVTSRQKRAPRLELESRAEPKFIAFQFSRQGESRETPCISFVFSVFFNGKVKLIVNYKQNFKYLLF